MFVQLFLFIQGRANMNLHATKSINEINEDPGFWLQE